MSLNDQQLMQTMQEIGGLLFRKLYDDLNETEEITLRNWLNQRDPADRQFFEQITDWEQIQDSLKGLYIFDEASAWRDIQKKIQFENELIAPEPIISLEQPRRSYRKYYMVAAIGLVLIVGISVIYTVNKRKTIIDHSSQAQRFQNDVAPGGNKAILALADGQRIVLDSAMDGELAKQGATSVLKLDNGQVVYQATTGYKRQMENPATYENRASYNTISTPRGGQYEIQLPDGSKVWLNAASSLRFPTVFSGKERAVELTGEAYFQIARNASLPFKVSLAGNHPTEIEAVGTEFDVMAYPEEADQRTTLVEGAVKVKSEKQLVLLQPGQQTRLINDGSTASLQVLSNVNAGEVTAWKNGLFEFQDASIQSIMRQAARWYDVDVVYQGDVKQQFIGKIPRRMPLSTLLKILESTGWVHFIIEGKKITVAP